MASAFLVAVILSSISTACPMDDGARDADSPPSYGIRAASADGIGKAYFGREIAAVMGFAGAEWLERPERFAEERPDLVLEALALRPGDVVADLGAGTGYFALRIAKLVRGGRSGSHLLAGEGDGRCKTLILTMSYRRSRCPHERLSRSASSKPASGV